MEAKVERNLELLKRHVNFFDMEADAEDEDEEETDWVQICRCVEEMENLESAACDPRDKKKAAALDRLEDFLMGNF